MKMVIIMTMIFTKYMYMLFAFKVTMHVLKSNEEITSFFIMGTCQLLSKSYSSSHDHMNSLLMSLHSIPKQYVIVCGSQAEFYIRPLNTCIADIDFLVCETDELACIDNSPVLPSDISGLAEKIRCYEIESYNEFPGFVRLRVFCEIKYSWKHKEYRHYRNLNLGLYKTTDRTRALNCYLDRYNRLSGKNKLPRVTSGPAIKTPYNFASGPENDVVFCMFCPQWPRDAQTWPLRPRRNGWPTTETISEVVRNGCHVVYAQHRACRDDILQWRLSFSVAEVILLQSWTKTQQIVYHLLRFFAKRELIQKDCPKEDEVLCPYHLKTLMLWTCEEMPSEWWDYSYVVAICCKLLSILSDWLKRRHCPNYFIPEANLFHQSSTAARLHQTERRVNDFLNPDILSRWFVGSYILPITRTRFQFLNPGKTTPDFMDYILPLIAYRKRAMPLSVEIVVARKFYLSNINCRRAAKIEHSGIVMLQQTQGNLYLETHKEMPYLPTTEKDLCFKYTDYLLHCLQFAYALSTREVSWDCNILSEFVNAISLQPKMLWSPFHNFPNTYRAQSSRCQFMRAQDLMKNLTGLNSHSEFKLLYLMSKEFLRRTLETAGYEYNVVTTAALTYMYLAALHFSSSEYQQAIRLCLPVISNQTPQEEKEKLNAGCLLFIDDIARIVGLCVLHEKVIDNNLKYNGGRLCLDLRLSQEGFAHYLTALSSERSSTQTHFVRDFPDASFPMDNNVKALVKRIFVATLKSRTQRSDVRQIVYCRVDSLTETEATATNPSIVEDTVIELLIGIALENMMSFYTVILKDFGMQCNVVDCYRALYF